MNKREKFLDELNKFISKAQGFESIRDSLNCGNCFDAENDYEQEKILIEQIKNGEFATEKAKGDCLELFLKRLFSRIKLLHAPDDTSHETNIGQIDIQIIPLDEEAFFNVLGIQRDYPNGFIGECKNYPKKTNKVGREDIEKMCWRTCKGGCIGLFVTFNYTKEALDEISEFNLHCNDICSRCKANSLIAPITIDMLSIVVEHNINFCYFLKWAIATSKSMSIRPHLSL
jgi:hypothetical protein